MPRRPLTDADFERVRELNNELQSIMTKYMTSSEAHAGPYAPIGQAKWRAADGVQKFLKVMGR